MKAEQLGRIRLGARAILVSGIVASLAANMLAADPSVPGVVIAGWSPIALLLTVELLTRVPAGRGWKGSARVVAAWLIAGIAAWVSYWHMVEVALAYGEASVAAHLLPLSVDGLVIVAAVTLGELNAGAPKPKAATRAPEPRSAPISAPAPVPVPIPAPRPQNEAQEPSETVEAIREYRRAHPKAKQLEVAEAIGKTDRTVRRHWKTTEPPALTAVPTLAEPKEANA